MIVMKFGGSSLQTAERIRESAAIVEQQLAQNPVLVLSAMGNTTDELLEAWQNALKQKDSFKTIENFHRDLIAQLELPETLVDELLMELDSLLTRISFTRESSLKSQDLLVSFGERISVQIFSAYLNGLGLASFYVNGWDAGIMTTSDFTRAEVLPESYRRIREQFKEERTGIPVVTGYIAKDIQGNITTLGRGGTDLTASVLGKALGAKEIQLWKDVDGILSADPRLIAEAQPIARLSFAEAAELAYFGAKVLHPTSILPAMSSEIPVRVKNHRSPSIAGTLILNHRDTQGNKVVAIAHKKQQILVHIASTRMLGQSGFLATVFQIFSELGLSVDVIATSEVSISLTLGSHHRLSLLQEKLQRVATVKLHDNKSIVSLIGNFDYSSDILEKIMRALNSEGIHVRMFSHGASEHNTSLVIDDQDCERCVAILYRYLFKEGVIV